MTARLTGRPSAEGPAPTIRVNGGSQPLQTTILAELIVRLGYDADGQGIAVALNGEVVPRRRWKEQALEAGDEIEIVGAVQGG